MNDAKVDNSVQVEEAVIALEQRPDRADLADEPPPAEPAVVERPLD